MGCRRRAVPRSHGSLLRCLRYRFQLAQQLHPRHDHPLHHRYVSVTIVAVNLPSPAPEPHADLPLSPGFLYALPFTIIDAGYGNLQAKITFIWAGAIVLFTAFVFFFVVSSSCLRRASGTRS